MKKTGMFSAAVLAVACGMAFAFAACQPESEEQKIPEPVIRRRQTSQRSRRARH